MHFNDNQTLSLRVVDPIADEGVWAMKDDRCISCCHEKSWGKHAEAKMEIISFPFVVFVPTVLKVAAFLCTQMG